MHYVERGDTLYSVAWRYGIDWRNLARWNDLDPPYMIYPGRHLKLDPDAVVDSPPGLSSSGSGQASGASRPIPAVPRRWQWPAQGEVLRDYAASRPRHGIDIGGNVGDPVYAADAGRVVYSGTGLKGYGNLLIIKHDRSYLSAYGFNRRLLVTQGSEVTAGQQIAEMGTGPRSQPTLHFEIRRDGQPLDPMTVLPERQ